MPVARQIVDDVVAIVADESVPMVAALAALEDYAQERCATFDEDFAGNECPSRSVGIPHDEDEYQASLGEVQAILDRICQ